MNPCPSLICSFWFITTLSSSIFFHVETITRYQGRIQDFKLGGGALKKIAPSGERRENIWGISCEKSRFYAKKSYFFPIAEGGVNIFGVFRVKNHDFTPKNHIFSNFRGGASPWIRPWLRISSFLFLIPNGRCQGRNRMVVEFTYKLLMQSVPICTKVVVSNPAHGELCSIQYYVIKFVSDWRQVYDFLRVPQ